MRVQYNANTFHPREPNTFHPRERLLFFKLAVKPKAEPADELSIGMKDREFLGLVDRGWAGL